MREPIPTAENIEGVQTRLVDLSGLEPWFVTEQIEFLKGRASRIVTLPDLGPTQPGIVPTGSVIEFDANRYPEWLRHVRGADIGCGMTLSMLETRIGAEDFRKDQQSLDSLRNQLREISDRAALGGGNHFLDFAVNGAGEVGVVIHTGSFGDRQVELGKLVEKMDREGKLGDVDLYMREYRSVISAGVNNRLEILRAVERVYGKSRKSQDLIHNTIEFNGTSGQAVVYKGAINVSRQGQQPLFLPSSMADIFVLYEPGLAVGAENLWAAPHGTGRRVARGDVDKETYISLFGDSRGKIKAHHLGDIKEGARLMVPTGMGLPVTELPFVYRSVDKATDIMQANGLMGKVIDYWQPIAYLGHL